MISDELAWCCIAEVVQFTREDEGGLSTAESVAGHFPDSHKIVSCRL
jgi:hypothetical protein